jgi:hypothetical protein
MLDVEQRVFDEHLADWLRSHAGRVVLVKDSDVIGFFDDEPAALEEGARRFGLVSFLVRRVDPTPYTLSAPALTLGILRANPA